MAGSFQIAGIAPSADLAPYVDSYDIIEADTPGAVISGISLPITNIVFNYGDPVQYQVNDRLIDAPLVSFDGMVSTYWFTHVTGNFRFITAKLKLFALHHLIKGDVTEMTNNAADISDFGLRIPHDVLDRLHFAAETGGGVAEKVAIIEGYLRSVFCQRHTQAPADLKNALLEMTGQTRRSEQYVFSDRHLRRCFKRYLGVPPSQYYDMKRIKKACYFLLEKPGMRITDVAVEVGYYDLSHFHRSFNKYIGESPSQFRSSALENPMAEFLHNN